MIEGEDQGQVIRLEAGASPSDPLPFVVELWNRSRTAPERIVGRAANVVLARAILLAVTNEHLDRKVVLRRGAQVLAESE